MDIRENKLELGIVVLTVIAAVGFFRAFGNAEPEKDLSQEISYHMPRPKGDLVGEFGLGDREIDRRYVNPFSRNAAAVEAKKAAAKVDPKNKIKAPRNAAVTTATALQERARRYAAYVRTVEKAQRALAMNAMEQPAPPQAPAEEYARTVVGKPSANIEEKEDSKRSPAQWRALLAGQPTKENMNKLVEALAKHEVDEALFFDIVDDLLKNQNAQKQETGMYGLTSHVSASSFAFAFNMKNDPNMPQAQKDKVDPYLATYSTKPAILIKVAQMKEPTVALKAISMALTAIQTAKANPTPNPGTQGTSLADWSRFQQAFHRLATAGADANVRQQAAQILTLFPPVQA